MRAFGWALFVFGAVLVVWGLAMDTTVPNEVAVALGDASTRTHNLGLLQNRELTVQIGLALLICGSVLAASPQSGDQSRFIAAEHPESDSSSDWDIRGRDDSSDLADEELERLGIRRHGQMYFFEQTGFATAGEAIEAARANRLRK